MGIKQKKGISLIVLVITIIVMIILATAIILSLNSAGIIGKANKSVEDTNFKQLETAANVGYSEAILRDYTSKADIEREVRSYLLNNGYSEEYLSNYKFELGDKGIVITKIEPVKVTNPYADKEWDFAYTYTSDDGWSSEITTGTPTGDIVAKFYKIDEETSAYSLVIEGKGEMGSPLDVWVMKAYNEGLNITEAIVCEGIESIGGFAFAMTNISNVRLATTIKKIEDNVFNGCEKLTKIDLPQNLTHIEYGAFCDCTGLTSLILPDNVVYIGGDAFKRCSSLKTVRLSKNIDRVHDKAFYDCSSLSEVIIPSTSTSASLGYNVFVGCNALKILKLPKEFNFNEGTFNCGTITDVYYAGSEEDWGKLATNIASMGCLSYTNIHYNASF